MSPMSAIGGYFELELPSKNTSIYPDAYRFQSAGAAFYALLLTGRPRRVWMPRYICDSMFAPLVKAGTEILYYSINQDFSIADELTLGDDEWLLYVNYFGVCTERQKEILKKFNSQQVIFDNSQAFFSPPLDCLATIYSPRKFFGLPDGGLMVTTLPVPVPKARDDGSLQRTSHLLKRMAVSPEAGYADYQAAERTLESIEPKRMSLLTERMLTSIDFSAVRSRRNKNFFFYHKSIGQYNHLKLKAEIIDGPLCYPFYGNTHGMRERLFDCRVFVATYWKDACVRASFQSVEMRLVNNLLPLTCDQRYRQKDIEFVISIITKHIEGSGQTTARTG